jgi:hypothetical protein
MAAAVAAHGMALGLGVKGRRPAGEQRRAGGWHPARAGELHV